MDPKRFDVTPKPAVGNHQPLEESRILMKGRNIPMSCQPRGKMNREKAGSFKGVEEITEWLQREEVHGLLALRYPPLFYVD